MLSVYSTIAEAFTDDHRRLIEVVARQVSETIRQVTESEASTMQPRDDAQGLPPRERVERFVAAELDLASSQTNLSIIRIQLATFAQLENKRGRPLKPVPADDIISAIKRVLRGADVLFRYSETEFVVVLTQTDSTAATAVANRIAEILSEVRPGVMESVQPTFGVASAPADGTTLADLVRSGRAASLDSANAVEQSATCYSLGFASDGQSFRSSRSGISSWSFVRGPDSP